MKNEKPVPTKHDKETRKRSGKNPPPAQQREVKNQSETEKGSGEGVTGMQRGAGHPTGR